MDNTEPGSKGSEESQVTSIGVPSERLDEIERWAKGWKETLAGEPPETFYANLSLDVALDMILELTGAIRVTA